MTCIKQILDAVVLLCHNHQQYDVLCEQLILLAKKHGQLKQAIVSMIQTVMACCVSSGLPLDLEIKVIDALRSVTEGRIYAEVERAKITKRLATIKENAGDISSASSILQELQVETFGSMEVREKTDFILEQVRLCLATKDYTRANIISKKINIRFFKHAEQQDLKLRFYDLMTEWAIHEKQWLECCRHRLEVYGTPLVQLDEKKWSKALLEAAIFVILSVHDNEQSELLHRILADSRLEKLGLFRGLVKDFSTREIMRWPVVQEVYGKALMEQTSIFGQSDEGRQRWQVFRSRVIEHNIRVIAHYYTRIRMDRLNELLDLTKEQTEVILCEQVVEGRVYARIDRPAGVVTFQTARGENELLNAWMQDVDDLLTNVATVGHLIAKEEMVHQIKL